MKTTDFYKKLLEQAAKARAIIEAAEADLQRDCGREEELLKDGIVGEKMYHIHIAEFERKRDGAVEGALSMIDAVADEYGDIMANLGRLDGSQVDDNVMRLLNSGLQLTNEDWQELANTCRDNHVMTRILRERYNASGPKSDGKVLTFVQFGQAPQERREIFSSFAGLIKHTCVSGTVLDRYADRESYWNHLARESLGKMQPFGDEDFDSVNADFPVETQEPAGPPSIGQQGFVF